MDHRETVIEGTGGNERLLNMLKSRWIGCGNQDDFSAKLCNHRSMLRKFYIIVDQQTDPATKE